MGAAGVKRQHSEAFADSVAQNQHSMAVMLEEGTARASKSKSNTVDLTDGGGGVVFTVSAANSSRLTAAIADCRLVLFSSCRYMSGRGCLCEWSRPAPGGESDREDIFSNGRRTIGNNRSSVLEGV